MSFFKDVQTQQRNRDMRPGFSQQGPPAIPQGSLVQAGANGLTSARYPTPYEVGNLGLFTSYANSPQTNVILAPYNQYTAEFNNPFVTPTQGALTQRVPAQLTRQSNTGWF